MINALAASSGCVIPLKAERYSVSGLGELFSTIKNIKEAGVNEDLRVYGTLITNFDTRNDLDRRLKMELPETASQYNFRNFNSYITVTNTSNAIIKNMNQNQEFRS